MSLRSDAVVVTYEPDIATLLSLIAALVPQVDKIVLVDNGSSNLQTWRHQLPTQSVLLVELGSNQGIATALNAGFAAVRQRGVATFVTLFDQDSAPSDGMVSRLESYHDELTARGPVAQIGPYFFEKNRGYYLPFIEFSAGIPRRKHAPEAGGWTTADYLITSGSLVPLSAIDQVGALDDSLFIDYVDIEWGLRAKAAGLQSYGVFDVRMEHAIGEKALKLATVRLAMHKPIRRYYYYRNALLLCKRSYIPFSWKLSEVLRLSVKFFIFALFSRHRVDDVRMMTKGIIDGVRGRTGKLGESGGNAG